MTEDIGKKLTTPKGKFALEKHIKEAFENSDDGKSGISDACAAVVAQEGSASKKLFSSKLFLENIHFDLTYFPLKHLGYKMAAIAVSDILAMNGTPTGLGMSLGVSNRFSLEALEELMGGVRIFCKIHKVKLLQFEVNTSLLGLAASVSAFGEVMPDKMLARKGAKENDLICVSGDLASAYTGLILLEREKKAFEADPNTQPDLDNYHYVLERYLKPEPRTDIIQALAENNVMPSSMTVVANGLAAAALHICNASHVGCDLYEGKLPIDLITFQTLKELDIVATTIALNGGEDYELLFTIAQKDYDSIQKIKDVSVVGYVKDYASGCNLVTNDDKLIPLTAQEFAE